MRLLLFDPDHKGHHAGYILNLLRYWADYAKDELHIFLAVSNAFRTAHPDVVDFAEQHYCHLKWVPLDDDEIEAVLSAKSPATRGMREAKIIRRLESEYQPDQILCMYLDYLLLPLACKKLKNGSPISGIIFRQNPHYAGCFNISLNGRERIKALVKGSILKKALRSENLKGCLFMDPFLPKWVSRGKHDSRLFHCPDPVFIPDHKNAEREIRAHSQRRQILLFGVVTARKGNAAFLNALTRLTDSQLQALTLKVVGPTGEEAEEKRIQVLTEKLISRGCEIKRINKFISDNDIQPYFESCDAVATPYVKHLGMSAIQVRAAAAGKPILSTNYGLMGKIAEANNLGLTFDMEDQDSIANAVDRFITGRYIYGKERAARFANLNSPEKYGEIISLATGIATVPLHRGASTSNKKCELFQASHAS